MGGDVAFVAADDFGIQVGNETVVAMGNPAVRGLPSIVFAVRRVWNADAFENRSCLYTCHFLVDCVAHCRAVGAGKMPSAGVEPDCDVDICRYDFRIAIVTGYRAANRMADDFPLCRYFCFCHVRLFGFFAA